MKEEYICPYCGYEMNEDEAESAVDCGCPSCRHIIDWEESEYPRYPEIIKKILILIILACTINIQAQNWKKGLAVVGYHTATIAIGAIADASFNDGFKSRAHALHAVEIGMVLTGPFIFKPRGSGEIISYLFSYGFIRFSLFDSFYNWQRGLPTLYNGTTSEYDKFMSKIPPDGRAWIKGCSLIVGFAIPIKEMT